MEEQLHELDKFIARNKEEQEIWRQLELPKIIDQHEKEEQGKEEINQIKQILSEEARLNMITKQVDQNNFDTANFNSRFEKDFETIRYLAKGGFGIVFEVKQIYDECKYAVKRISLPTEDQCSEKVMREVKALAKLEHQNIVRYFSSWVEYPPIGWQQRHDEKWIENHSSDVDKTSFSLKNPKLGSGISDFEQKSNEEIDDSIKYEKTDLTEGEQKDLSSNTNSPINKQENPSIYLYIQMQLCKETLKDWLYLHKERDFEDVIHFFSQILNAVEYIHQRGFIHRDLKPSNIFFSLDSQIKVGDFGLVKDMESDSDLGVNKEGSLSVDRGHTVGVGTQLYMSPEQLVSRTYDKKVDIYSLGLIFLELLVTFSTEMERIKVLTDVKSHSYPTNFSIEFPDEHFLLQNMVCDDPSKRLAIPDIKNRPPLKREDSGYSDNTS